MARIEGSTETASHVMLITCSNCGADLPENFAGNTCPHCHETLIVRQDATVSVTLPPLSGDTG